MIERSKYLLPDEFGKLLRAAKRCGARDYMLILLGGNLGLRVGELVQLRKEDFLGDGLVRVRTLKQRGDKRHEIDIDPRTERESAAYRKRAKGYLFPGREKGSHLTKRQAEKIFKALCAKARLNPDYSIHSLRHYRGIVLWDASKDLFYTKSQLRHSSVQNTELYMHVSPSKREEMRRKLGKLASV